MRLSRWFGPTAAELAIDLQLWLLILYAVPSTQAANFSPVTPPDLDLSQLGRVALTGDFDAISLYSYTEENENGFNTNGTQSLISQLPNGDFATSANTDAYIKALCPFVMKDGTLAGVIVGGNFTSFGDIEAQGIALFDPSTSKITPLPGLAGYVSAILCDQDTNTVWVGGDFKGANSTNAIAWVGMDGWSNLPFEGFNGPVTSIAKLKNGNIVFGGSFTGLGNATTPNQNDTQTINLSTANITSGSAALDKPGLRDPRNVVCSAEGQQGPGHTWLIKDQSPGFWRADMNFGYEPSMLRIRNTRYQGRGTKVFRFTAIPDMGIMNLTYTDPATKEKKVCDARCHLSHDTSVKYQDFHFVNTVGMNGFQIDVSEWYGNGGGFDGIELHQDGILSSVQQVLTKTDFFL